MCHPERSPRAESKDLRFAFSPANLHKIGTQLLDIPHQTPSVTAMRVVPIAGHDSMLLNLSGAHAPFFTRNLVIITDNAGHTGVGEVPGGEKIRQTLEDARPLVVGQTIGSCTNVLAAIRTAFAHRDAGGRGKQ